MNSLASLPELLREAASSMQQNEPARALELLSQAEQMAPRSPDIQFSKGGALRKLGDMARALAAFDAALEIEPYHLPSILSKGVLLEDAGRTNEAAAVFRNALAVKPTSDGLPPYLAAAHTRARARAEEEARRLRGFFAEALDDERNKFSAGDRRRFDECLEIFSGRTRAYNSQPSLLHFPALPQVSYFERSLMPWLGEVEAASEEIEQELQAVLASASIDRFAPYISFPPGVPVNQWGELNNSRKWSTWFFWLNGVRQDEACLRAPKTAAILDAAPLIRIPNIGPTAMFSSLAPRMSIPPHTGSTNVRAIVHLPLILPGPAWFRVGNDRREWRKGEAWAFDDTVEHEARNEAEETRIILIFDVWNPYLSEIERRLVSALLQAKHAYQRKAGVTAAQLS